MRYRPEIDGLRAIAVLPVMFFHAGFELFSGGFVGVDIFFVISGYLITSILLKDRGNENFSFANFYERRVRRIFPALFFVLFISTIFAWMWLPPEDLTHFSKSLRSVAVFASNFHFYSSGGYFDSASDLSPLLHTWSLAVEEQFYFLFPFFVLLTWSFRRRTVFILLCTCVLASLFLAEWASSYYSRAAFYLLPTRVWELLLGSAAAYYSFTYKRELNNQYLSSLGLILIIYSVLSFTESTPFPSFYSLVPTLGTILIILFCGPKTYVYQVLSNRVLVSVGLISYSAYLWHQPVFSFARHRILVEPSVFLMPSLIVLVGLLAFISWKFVEKPFRTANMFTRNQVFGLGLFFSVLIFGAGHAGSVANTAGLRFSDESLIVYEQTKTADYFWNNCLNYSEKRHPEKGCLFGEAADIVAIVGDSHSTTLAKPIRDILPQSVSMYLASVPGCPPLLDFMSSVDNSLTCSDSNKRLMTYILLNENIQTVVLSAQWALYASGKRFDNAVGGKEKGEGVYFFRKGSFDERNSSQRASEVVLGYISTIEMILAAGKKVILVDQIPVPGWDIPKRYIMSHKFGEDGDSNSFYTYPLKEYTDRMTILEGMRSIDNDNYKVVVTSQLFCDQSENSCSATKIPKLYFMDDNHPSYEGAKLIAKEVFDLLFLESET